MSTKLSPRGEIEFLKPQAKILVAAFVLFSVEQEDAQEAKEGSTLVDRVPSMRTVVMAKPWLFLRLTAQDKWCNGKSFSHRFSPIGWLNLGGPATRLRGRPTPPKLELPTPEPPPGMPATLWGPHCQHSPGILVLDMDALLERILGAIVTRLAQTGVLGAVLGPVLAGQLAGPSTAQCKQVRQNNARDRTAVLLLKSFTIGVAAAHSNDRCHLQ